MRPAKAAAHSLSSADGLALVHPEPAAQLIEPASAVASRGRPRNGVHDWMQVRGLALRQLNRFASLEPKVLKGDDPDAVHDLRVASRRLQQVIRLLYPDPPKEVRRALRSAKTARRVLSDVRNCDVYLTRVGKSLARRTSRRETLETVRDYLTERRAKSFEKAQRKLSKANLPAAYIRLKEHLDWGATARLNGYVRTTGVPVLPEEFASEPLQKRVGGELVRLWREYEEQIAASRRDGEAPALHGARIATKRLRYLLEVLDALEVGGSSEVLTWLRALQGRLGGWHDLEVFEQMLLKMVARPKFLRDRLETAMSIEKLVARNRQAKKKYVEKFFALAADSAGSQRLKDWITSRLAESSEEAAQV
ncbi:MAG TPA: CHAD domain-containing protein [Terriglobia bacterium]|nr:CHAD domain-containing protein [Terriglobia bacterium]